MVRGLIAGFIALLGLMCAPAANAAEGSHAHTLDELVTQLKKDPVLVQPVLGTGDTAGVHKMLTRLKADIDVPVYVVLAALPDELAEVQQPAEQAAALLHSELGDGLYVIRFTGGSDYTRGWGAAADLDLSAGLRDGSDADRILRPDGGRPTAVLESVLILRSAGQPGKAISDKELRALTAEPWAFISYDVPDRADSLARRWVFTIAAALTVLIGGLTLALVAGKYPLTAGARGRPNPSIADVPTTELTKRARGELDKVQRDFDKLTAAELGSPHALATDEALQAARAVIDSDDKLDQTGAWVLSLIAGRELVRLRNPAKLPYRPCVVNPDHGEATATVPLADSSIDAPACTSCARTQGQFLSAKTWRGERPYLETNTVWARTGFGALVDDLARQVLDSRKGRR